MPRHWVTLAAENTDTAQGWKSIITILFLLFRRLYECFYVPFVFICIGSKNFHFSGWYSRHVKRCGTTLTKLTTEVVSGFYRPWYEHQSFYSLQVAWSITPCQVGYSPRDIPWLILMGLTEQTSSVASKEVTYDYGWNTLRLNRVTVVNLIT